MGIKKLGISQQPSQALIERSRLIKQGAEARVYILDSLVSEPSIYWPSPSDQAGPSKLPSQQSASTDSQSTPSSFSPNSTAVSVILKHRFPKTYRHPTLNQSLTKSRLSFEARALVKCLKNGISVPRVLWVDERLGVLGMEMIEGWSVREILGGGAEGEVEIEDEDEEEQDGGENLQEGLGVENLSLEGKEESEGLKRLKGLNVTPEDLMEGIGTAIAKLHSISIIHGDLTTSNMMIRLTPESEHPFEVVLIDFGLSSQATFAEHFAVDLYVLERAFASTHPASENLYAGVIAAYSTGMGKKWVDIERKLKEVRLRGRKRDMTG